MTRRVIVARGGALPPQTGLGRYHHDVLARLTADRVAGFSLGETLEYPIGGGVWGRYSNRRYKQPKKVARLCKEEQSRSPDSILHITDQEQAHLVPHVRTLPVCVTVHDLFLLEPREVRSVLVGDPNPGVMRRADLRHIRAGLGRADLLICISEATAVECRDLWPDKEVVAVHHGIDTEAFDPSEHPRKAPAGLSSSDVNVLFVGSEDPRKRLEFILEVLAHIPAESRQKVVLHKIGAESNQDIRRRLESEAQRHGIRLNWVGRVDDDEFRAWYQHVDLLLFPSIAEGFGAPPLEAMASGCPVRVADMPAHNEVAPDEWKLPPDDLKAWSSELSTIIFERVSMDGPRGPDELALTQARRFDLDRWSSSMHNAWSSLVSDRAD
ncbi:MAG TPA: glycosyltransferase [Candidatus Poseidoniales archaeon]|nr:glycosyltransferase [Candidatus Poseidoniales archaeon]